MRSFLILALALMASLSFAAGNAAIEKSLEVTAGQQADFVQKFTPKGFTRERVEKGSVVFGDAPRMRWSYTAPEEKLFVFDGTTSWLYAPADRQVMIARLSDEDRKGLPFVILSNSEALRASYEVRESTANGMVTTRLTPKTTAALVRDLVVMTDARDGRPRRIEYSDRQGNRTVFEFTNYRRASIGASTFRFDPPPGVEIVRQ